MTRSLCLPQAMHCGSRYFFRTIFFVIVFLNELAKNIFRLAPSPLEIWISGGFQACEAHRLSLKVIFPFYLGFVGLGLFLKLCFSVGVLTGVTHFGDFIYEVRSFS